MSFSAPTSVWPEIQQWISHAANPVEVLPPASNSAETAADTGLPVSTHLGAVVAETGGIFVDFGWIRLLGSGHPRLSRTLPDWNESAFATLANPPSCILVADDAVGGFFAVNAGDLGGADRAVYYFAPDTLEWECTGAKYPDFLRWCFNGDLATYYAEFRWQDWQTSVGYLSGEQVYSLDPPANESGKELSLRRRKIIGIRQHFREMLTR